MTAQEAAELAGISPLMIRVYIRRKLLRAKCVPGMGQGGRTWRIDKEDFDAWMKKREAKYGYNK